MKFNFLQGDFSAGELTKRAQGAADSAIYKAGLGRIANAMPARVGSIASRAGGNFLADPLLAQNPVAHFPIHDSPDGDFVVEIGLNNIRLMDKFGVRTWSPSKDPTQFIGFGAGADVDVWSDLKSRTVYMNHSDLGVSVRGVNLGDVTNPVGVGDGTGDGDGSWDLAYNLAGDPVTLRVTNTFTLAFADYPLSRGAGSVNFGVIDAGHRDFNLKLLSGSGAILSSSLWGLKLTKNGAQVSNGSSPFTNLLTVRASPGFWTSDGKFYVLFVGGGAGDVYALRHTPKSGVAWAINTVYPVGTVVNNRGNQYIQMSEVPPGATTSAAAGAGPVGFGTGIADNTCTWDFYGVSDGWDFQPLNYYNSDTAFDKTKISTVAVYQSRVWLGTNDSQATLYATMAGYGITAGRGRELGPTNPNKFTFRFGAATVRHVGLGAGLPNYTFDFSLSYDPTVDNGQFLAVTVDGVPQKYTTDFSTFVFYNATDNAYWGIVTFFGGHEPAVGAKVVISRAVPIATDPLSLKLASPTAKLAWMSILRGLVLGSVRTEKTIPAETLALDPATGVAPNLLDHSSVGSDDALPSLSVNEKIVYVQRGRKIIRQASVRMNWESGEPQGGLISEDTGVLGEHLTAAKVRSLCFLKGPVPRIVLAFDDGTGAVATLGGQVGMAWSRFTIPSCFGGIYSVASLDSTEDSQLWVGTENGVTLFYDTFESDITHKTKMVAQAAPAAPTRVLYDDETPLPPVMDGWTRLGCYPDGNHVPLSGVTGRNTTSASLLGQQVYLLSAGQVYGPFLVILDGAGRRAAQNAALSGAFGYTWVDGAGNRRPQEVYVGLAYPEHRFTTLPIEGGNPVGSSQNLTSRKPQLYVRYVDSYAPKVNGVRANERGAADPTDQVGGRITGDREATELNFQRGAVIDVVMDTPLRMEISALHGGIVMNNL
jgi:hypothetical protein